MYHILTDELRSYFSAYGTVNDAVVMKDPVSRRSRGFGFITFDDIESVDEVLEDEPHTIDSRKVEAKRAVPRSESREGMSNSGSSTPVTGNTKSSSPASAAKLSVNSSKVESNPGNNSNSSTRAIKLSKVSGGGGTGVATFNEALKVTPSEDVNGFCKIFVGGLHYDTRDGEFRAYFEKYGAVQSAEVMINRETHKSRGFGFIIFEKEEVSTYIV